MFVIVVTFVFIFLLLRTSKISTTPVLLYSVDKKGKIIWVQIPHGEIPHRYRLSSAHYSSSQEFR